MEQIAKIIGEYLRNRGNVGYPVFSDMRSSSTRMQLFKEISRNKEQNNSIPYDSLYDVIVSRIGELNHNEINELQNIINSMREWEYALDHDRKIE